MKTLILTKAEIWVKYTKTGPPGGTREGTFAFDEEQNQNLGQR